MLRKDKTYNRRKPTSDYKPKLDYIVSNWAFFLSIGSLAILGLGCLTYHINPLYTFNEIKHRLDEINYNNQQKDLKKNFINLHNKLGIEFLYNEQFDEARKEFNQALKVDPLNQNATKGLFECDVFAESSNVTWDPEITNKKLNSLIEEIKKEENQNDSLPYLYLGDFYLSRGYMKDAFNNYIKATELNNLTAAAYNGMGNIYFAADNFEDARKEFQEAHNLSPWNVLYLNNIGLAYGNLNDSRNATLYYKYALGLANDYWQVYDNLAEVATYQGDLETALKIQERLMEQLGDHGTENKSYNQAIYFYSTSSKNINLYDTNSKKCHFYQNIGLTYYLSGSEIKGREYMEKAKDLHLQNKWDKSSVEDLLTDRIDSLQELQPNFTNNITKFRNEFLNSSQKYESLDFELPPLKEKNNSDQDTDYKSETKPNKILGIINKHINKYKSIITKYSLDYKLIAIR
jgi:Flp pilus assembly protein TadD